MLRVVSKFGESKETAVASPISARYSTFQMLMHRCKVIIGIPSS